MLLSALEIRRLQLKVLFELKVGKDLWLLLTDPHLLLLRILVSFIVYNCPLYIYCYSPCIEIETVRTRGTSNPNVLFISGLVYGISLEEYKFLERDREETLQ